MRGPKKIERVGDTKNKIYFPSYGKIIGIFHDPIKKTNTVSVYLSLFDIHKQYFPYDCILESSIVDDTGIFNIAYSENKSRYNKKVINKLKCVSTGDDGYDNIYVLQISGKYVRKISSPKGYQRKIFKSGDYLGMIYFGSRVDIIFPSKYHISKDVKIGVRVNPKKIVGMLT